MIWNLLLWADRIVFWSSAVVTLISFFGRSKEKGSALEQFDGSIEFRMVRSGYVFVIMVFTWIPLLVTSALRSLTKDGFFSYLMIACAVLALIETCIEFPGTIILDSAGISQRFWLGRRKHIPWSKIEEVRTTVRGPIRIISKEHTKIQHAWQSGRDRFLLEIKKHCGHELPDDFPREPLGESGSQTERANERN